MNHEKGSQIRLGSDGTIAGVIEIRPTSPETAIGAAALQRACFPAPFPEDLLFSGDDVAEHIRRFPEGQFVAVHEGLVVGSCTNMLASREDWDAHRGWADAIGGLSLARHNPDGTVLYGVDISIHPEFRGQGLARRFYQKRFDLVQELGLEFYGTVCRLPGASESGLSAETFAQQVLAGERIDSPLTPFLRIGLRYGGLIHGYMDDEESLDAGAILTWEPTR